MESSKYEDLVRYLRDKAYPTGTNKKDKYVLRRSAKKFTYDKDCNRLFYVEESQGGLTFKRKVVKEEEKEQFFLECHHSSGFAGHNGRDRTIQRIKEKYYWPEYYKDTVEMIKNCDQCHRKTERPQHYVLPSHPTGAESAPDPVNMVSSEVWDVVEIDVIDARKESTKGNRYLLIHTDNHSKFVEAVPLPDKRTRSVAKGLYKTYCRLGAPAQIISDQGSEFVNQVCEQLTETFQLQHRITSAFHPQSNALDEGTNQTIKSILRKVIDKNGDDWDDCIDGVLLEINTTVSSSTNVSPFFLMFGRQPNIIKKGEAARPSPNSMPRQVEATRPLVSAGSKQRKAATPQFLPIATSTPLQSMHSTDQIKSVKIVSGESLVLIKLPNEDNLGGVILDEGWYQLSAQDSTYPRDVPLYKSPQFEVGTVEFDPYIVTGTKKPSQECGVTKYNIKVNVWFSPAKTHCGIHNHHTDPEMLEVHTQVYGTGRMQKFHENDFKSLYEEVMMAPGFTHDPFTGVKKNGDLFYGWHQYYSDTDCIWMAIEYHPA